MQTIGEHWREFSSRVVPAGARPPQRRDMKIAFYAGGLSMLEAAIDARQDGNEAQVVSALHELYREVACFFSELMTEQEH